MRRADVGDGRQQEEVLHVEDARGLVGALEQAAEAAEVPGLAVRHGGVGDAGEQVARQLDLAEEVVRRRHGLGAGGRGRVTIR